jgi:hypothetical protein
VLGHDVVLVGLELKVAHVLLRPRDRRDVLRIFVLVVGLGGHELLPLALPLGAL